MDPIQNTTVQTPAVLDGQAPNGTGDANASPETTDPTARPYTTVEEAEAYWQKRISGKDRAHNAAEQALRQELESLRAAQAGTTQGAGGQSSGGTTTGPNPEVTRLQQELERERSARVVDTRKAKYPALAGAGTPDAVFAAADEATLARLNALADDGQTMTGAFAPTAPRRDAAAPPKPINEMSKQELQAALKVESDRMLEARRNGV